uniref:SpoIIIAC/SpoIIIAD family protein n=1 Tax=Gemmiger qucibialis TaxID=2997294 RepID=UPI004025C49C
MLILKAAALAIVVCVLVLCLKNDQPGFAFLLSLCGAAGLLWFAVQQLRPLLA